MSKLFFAKTGDERDLLSAELQKAWEIEISVELNILRYFSMNQKGNGLSFFPSISQFLYSPSAFDSKGERRGKNLQCPHFSHPL